MGIIVVDQYLPDYFYRLTINLNNNAIRERFWTRDHRIDADKIRRSDSRRLICSVNVVFRSFLI
jgi:predicted thioredoxin/glutaredoxin